MGFGSMLSGISNVALPALGAVGGFALSGGNPVGAMLGGTIGSSIMGNITNWQNYQLQRENYNYQRRLQGEIFGREDNATQRRVEDLVRAGLSPTLAAGSTASAGAVINTTAPQRANPQAPDLMAVMSLMKMKQDISMTEEQKALIRAQTNKIGIEALMNAHDYNYYRNKAIPSNATNMEKMASTVLSLISDNSPKKIIKDMGAKIEDAIVKMPSFRDLQKMLFKGTRNEKKENKK